MDNNTICLCESCSKKAYPNKGKLNAKKGQSAKLRFTDGKFTEYMWVIVTNVDVPMNDYEGTLNNEPVLLNNIVFGDVVMFKREDIYDVGK